ncbi:SDR family NAD(P)-dependent oxidoreductase [Actinoallomurus rhizosphaericola]|uniref:SDR family NAD(P)-dependent oxidoreductase n=1 Tax=Actinoallomurus rhizosphaericola TaxID=2952536 RepID=UPI002093C493|nr:SDR family oxidoreductase [Actinoallomurus rhizosphaericola]MCO5994924.1 SDR family oxidoreductase [Actinoallomurus rhizosphaericola]
MKALITGASRGLGLALARALAQDGWTLILDARGAAGLEKAAADLAAAGADVTAIPGDVADPAHRDALVRASDGLDLLVNNASTLGATPLPHLADHPLLDLERAFAINVLAPLALVQGVLPALRARRGAIVNVTSDAAREAYEGWGGYGATKAALDQLSGVLAVEEPEIAVWWVDPGEMRTRMLADAGEDADAAPLPEDVAVPALRRLITERPASGRYAVGDL